MASQTKRSYSELIRYPNIKYVFYGLALLVFFSSIGHLYIIEGLTDIYLGLPLWLWVQNGVFAAMIVIAWIAVRLRAMAMKEGI